MHAKTSPNKHNHHPPVKQLTLSHAPSQNYIIARKTQPIAEPRRLQKTSKEERFEGMTDGPLNTDTH